MAKYNITHSCGHTQEHQIYGTNRHGERDRKVEWLENNLCGECYKAEMTAWATESNKQWPELVGSEKQIAWAMRIRASIYPQLEMLAANAEEDMEKGRKMIAEGRDARIKRHGVDISEKLEADLDKRCGRGIRAINEARKHMTSAKWWIENFGYNSDPWSFVRRF